MLVIPPCLILAAKEEGEQKARQMLRRCADKRRRSRAHAPKSDTYLNQAKEHGVRVYREERKTHNRDILTEY